LIQFQLRHQTFGGLLELAVLGGVDERVDAAVGQRQYHGEVVEPTVPEKSLSEVVRSVTSIQSIELIASQSDYWKNR